MLPPQAEPARALLPGASQLRALMMGTGPDGSPNAIGNVYSEIPPYLEGKKRKPLAHMISKHKDGSHTYFRAIIGVKEVGEVEEVKELGKVKKGKDVFLRTLRLTFELLLRLSRWSRVRKAKTGNEAYSVKILAKVVEVGEVQKVKPDYKTGIGERKWDS